MRLLNLLGHLARRRRATCAGAADAFERELAVARDAGLPTFLATTHGNLAETYLQLGDEAGRRTRTRPRASSSPASRAGRCSSRFSMMIAARLVAARGRPAEAVVLQAAADVVLERAAFALYDEDAEVRDELMAAARATSSARRRSSGRWPTAAPSIRTSPVTAPPRCCARFRRRPLTRREFDDAR